MLKNRTFCVDFDDYCDQVIGSLDILNTIHDKYPQFKVTLFTIPRRCSTTTIERAKQLGDWCQLAPHGWRHTRGECLSWTDTEAIDKISMAKDMGIDAPLFRAPAWLIDGDTYEACRQLNYIVASHAQFRIPSTGVLEYIYNLHTLNNRGIIKLHGHVTPVCDNYIEDMVRKSKLEFPADAKFVFPQECAICVS